MLLKNIVVGVLLGIAQLLLGFSLKKPLLGVLGMAAQIAAALVSSVLSLFVFPLYLLYTMRKSVAEQRGAAEGARFPLHRRVSFRIDAVDGPLRGNSYILSGKKTSIEFGREACDVVFPYSTSDVSRRHCMVYLRDGEAFLLDLRSTNGTYIVAPEKRLLPNVPIMLANGSLFYLAERKNLFKITNI